MGCITSKAITRSMSIREELRNRYQSRSAAWEELLTSHSGNDQLLASVCSSNANLKTTSFTLPSTDPPTNNINASHVPPFTRSKSCQSLREKEDIFNLKDEKRSFSFHVVEEYDDLLERIRLEFPRHDVNMQESTSYAEDECESSNADSASVETGWKRKAAARGLKSLDISPVELPAIARLGQKMIGQGQIYSPGTYVTPKFGSYNAPTITVPQNDTKQDAVFSPELLAAFEDCMQQLQLEEDAILRHMNEVTNSSNMYKVVGL